MNLSKSKVLVTCFAIVFLAYGIRFTFGMLYPEMMEGLNLSDSEMGLVYTSYLSIYTFLSVFIGFLTDIKGPKRTILLFLPFLSFGTFLMGFANNLTSAILFFSIAGVGASISWTPVAYWIQKEFQDKRGLSLGIVQVGTNSGFAVLGLTIPVLSTMYGWEACWMILGLISILLIFLVAFSSKSSYNLSESEVSLSHHLEEIYEVLKERNFVLGGLSYMFAAFAAMIPMTFIKAYAATELNFSVGLATGMFTIIGVLATIGALSLPPLSDKIGRKIVIVSSNLMMSVGLLGLALLSYSAEWVTIWTIFTGISYGCIWPLYGALSKDFFQWHYVGSVLGAWTLFAGIGLLASPYLGGLLADVLKSYRPAFLMGSMASVISIIFLLVTEK